MTTYIAKQPDKQGFIDFDEIENGTWQILFSRQCQIVQNRACDEFMQGLTTIDFPADKIPQVPQMNAKLAQHTGWGVEPVPALISTDKFYNLLKNKCFPAATFIRTREEIDYLKEPDLFHEYFGHCALLTNQAYADFVQWYGENALNLGCSQRRNLLLRLFWFTIEFGLFKTAEGFRIYGGGILSSPGESVYAIESEVPERREFVLLDVLRTPYRYDMMQPIYYYLNSFDDLYHLMDIDLLAALDKAIELGDFAPHPALHEGKEEKPC